MFWCIHVGVPHLWGEYLWGDSQYVPDPVSTVRKAALDRAVGTAVAVCDFRNAQTFQIECPQGGPLSMGNFVHRFNDVMSGLPLPGLSDAETVDHGSENFSLDVQFAALGRSEVVVTAVSGHLQQPRTHVARRHPTQPRPGVNQGLLKHVLNVVAGPGPGADQACEHALVAPDQGNESGFAALPNLFRQ